MQLNFRKQGSGPALILLHGLFGSLENLGAIARLLSDEYTVYSLDLRNHGRSPHAAEHDYAAMAADVDEFMCAQQLGEAILLGHSMGGKVAMHMALHYPQRVSGLIVADIAPVLYSPHHDEIFEGLFSLDLTQLGSRREADQHLQVYVSEVDVRSFLLKNLDKRAEGGFVWRINLEALAAQYANIMQGQEGPENKLPTLFIKGGDSDYLLASQQAHIAALFPSAQLKVIPATGHWLHAQKPRVFAALVKRFLSKESTED